jgi:hypothetical protein
MIEPEFVGGIQARARHRREILEERQTLIQIRRTEHDAAGAVRRGGEMNMAAQTHDKFENTPQADGNAHPTPLSSYVGMAIIGAIMMIMIVLQSAGAPRLIQ